MTAGGRLRLPDGAELHHESRGPRDAPTVVFVNSHFMRGSSWWDFTGELTHRFRVVTYDLRDQGASASAEGELTLATHVDDLRHLVDALGGPVHLVGTSVSTLICRDFAVAHPDAVAGMVLVGPVFNPFGGRRRAQLTRSWLRSLELGGPRALFDHLYPLLYAERTVEVGGAATYLALRERFLAHNTAAGLARSLRASLGGDDGWAVLTRVVCPVSLVVGGSDFFSSPASVAELARLMPDARSVVLPTAGHLAYVEAPAEFADLVARFVSEVEAARAIPIGAP
ncbi:alpha/beta hydrolase [Micromonospora sp. WMMD1082]|uniref:alpha/beta fold hydrolase n=1 Tax=Micromonospora sp. WMMD1082 TaxID=3016104 RepID=UPI002416C208|nr:alpha/beta hydrolase [Micromonospora sp. WMMD1082]MDG4794549.1 alpha/beta hydrolase [Micromonospora sp. WMMD1082]